MTGVGKSGKEDERGRKKKKVALDVGKEPFLFGEVFQEILVFLLYDSPAWMKVFNYKENLGFLLISTRSFQSQY
jgi:hypothetical protein